MLDTEERCMQYEVEVSGHDGHGAYFAQSALLRWSERTGKVLQLNRKLPPGATIFLRLLSWQGRNGLPLPYRVSRVAPVAFNTWDTYLAPLERDAEENISPALPPAHPAR